MNTSLLRAIQSETWAILPSTLYGMIDAARTGETIQAARGEQSRAGAIAVIPIQGVITQKRQSFLEEMFEGPGTSTEGLTAMISAAMADPAVTGVLFDVNSPGGTVSGVQEAADAIFKARGQKPMIAHVNTLAASAAYWLATQADSVVASPSSELGSIGVFAVHEDLSGLAEKMGINVTMISAGKFKTEGNRFEPLSDEAKSAIQKRIDAYYGDFVGAVARGRGVTAGAVRGGFGEGRVVGAKEAVTLGMADRIGTMIETLGKMGGSIRAEDEIEIVAEIDYTREIEMRRRKLMSA